VRGIISVPPIDLHEEIAISRVPSTPSWKNVSKLIFKED